MYCVFFCCVVLCCAVLCCVLLCFCNVFVVLSLLHHYLVIVVNFYHLLFLTGFACIDSQSNGAISVTCKPNISR